MNCWFVAWAGPWQGLCKIGKNSPDQSSVTVGFTLERIQQTTGELWFWPLQTFTDFSDVDNVTDLTVLTFERWQVIPRLEILKGNLTPYITFKEVVAGTVLPPCLGFPPAPAPHWHHSALPWNATQYSLVYIAAPLLRSLSVVWRHITVHS